LSRFAKGTFTAFMATLFTIQEPPWRPRVFVAGRYCDEEALMWFSLFSIVVGIALGLGLGAVVVDMHGERLGL
jgi:hypothetical protein